MILNIRFKIIVPTYNSYKQTGRLVSSLIFQTYQNWELIFVDGNSIKKHKNALLNYAKKDERITILNQNDNNKGIFGAMNQGFSMSESYSWIFFWGSDDWLPHESVLSNIVCHLKKLRDRNELCDLLICNARYVNFYTLELLRQSKFYFYGNFRLSMFLGFSPPHQACLISPNLRKHLSVYDENLSLSSDLDYFLNISTKKDLKIKLFDYEMIYLGSDGQSRKNNFERTKQVINCYWDAFGLLFFIPFIFRYTIRLFSIFRAFFIKTKFKNLN